MLWVDGYSEQDGVDTFYIVVTLYLNRIIDGIMEAKSEMDNFMLLYVFSNFAFSFEIVAKMTDFDGTADLKTTYKLKDKEE